jgi:hypothetical protein
LGERLTTLNCKIIVAKSKKDNAASKLAESSKEGYGSRRTVFLMLLLLLLLIYLMTLF